ncbi:ABC transporter permease [Streptomyces sp. NBC_00102]|uniref:ABC transporter permease n=1 Tax=Streptomyces sp. NBC_00102 TaxID=2975652 RepID=UPI002250C42A|nr:ABC transporter permease [Streptomyces sp. NBC_00102]MCX5401813.1 ABC transporter permease [Streptomyces sp. NBC_00102]
MSARTADTAERDREVSAPAPATASAAGKSGLPQGTRGGDRLVAAGRVAGRAAVGLLVPVGILVAWHTAARSGAYSPSQLPEPLAVARAARVLWERGELPHHVAISVQRVLLGFAAGAGAGLVLGGLVGLSTAVRRLLGPTIQALRAVPSLAWVPLLLLWLGIGETPKITLVAVGAFFPVYTTVASALDHADPGLRELGHAYGRRGPALLAQVLIPAAAPSVLAGLRLGLAQGWLFLVAAELIASSMGLGFLLIDSQNTGRTDILLLAIVLLALLGKATDAVLGAVERAVVRRWT